MGLILRFSPEPHPLGLDYTNDGLPAGMNVYVLDRDLLLALAAMVIERVENHGIRSRQPVGLAAARTSYIALKASR